MMCLMKNVGCTRCPRISRVVASTDPEKYVCMACKRVEWQNSIHPYVRGPVPRSAKQEVETQCNICQKVYIVMADNLLRNVRIHNRVVCNTCSVNQSVQTQRVSRGEVAWREVIRPYYPQVDNIGLQSEIIQVNCPKCTIPYPVKVLSLVRRIREQKSPGYEAWCRNCTMWFPAVRKAISDAQRGKVGTPLTEYQKAHLSEKITLKWREPQYRATRLSQIQNQWQKESFRQANLEANRAVQPKRSESLRRVMGTPEFKASQSRNSKELWKNPGYVENVRASMTPERIARAAKTLRARSPELQPGQSNRARELWQCDEYRKNREPYLYTREEIQDRISPLFKLIDIPAYPNRRAILECVNCSFVVSRRVDMQRVGRHCPKCLYLMKSKPEQEVREWVEKVTGEKSTIHVMTNGLEIDIYFPSKKIGIEYCGLYWHGEQLRGRSYHAHKLRQAEADGIRLVTLFEDEWEDRRGAAMGYLRAIFGIQNASIPARKCKLVDVAATTATAFYEEHHIQGAGATPLFSVGLVYDNTLISVMSANRHHRSDKVAELVLGRYANTAGINIIGGASRLFSAFKEKAVEEFNCQKVVSWSDSRWSQGGVYLRLGFFLEDSLPPDYNYFKRGERFSKQSLRKTPEERASGRTEVELRTEQGYDRIWDCGKKRWVYSLFH